MTNKTTDNKNSYLPVAWEYREIIEEQINKKNSGKVFYFDDDNKLEEVGGRIVEIKEEKSAGVFILMDNGLRIRVDRIITLFGKVGAAYNEYEAYANACMDCSGGYTKEELDNM
ncbi:hypothetical protein [Sphingobacterium gobiense]|uniref:Uncharacterized protein n=1 Tax=Sphingobacterium gobiense TaxID=1382456 RepID=A0A2S9JNB2_9SPHI|nr:hypothetical protein [Sphingobacterium gobiense]PRD54650.1 hypothetical protein C5749_14525 [Sphingobacterium gobiense]